MNKVHPLINFYSRYFSNTLTKDQEGFILSAYKKESFRKKTHLFHQGETNTRHYLIEKGLLRLYLIDQKGKDINLLFAKESQIIGDLATPEPTNFFLETIEDSVVYSISDAGIHEVIKQLDINNMFQSDNAMRRSYIHMQKRLVAILSKSAEENYLDFQHQYPDMVQRLPQYHIAAYLGISAEFLSKIIARTAKHR